MRKLCYLLSFLLHALLLLIILHARFQVTIHPDPPRVVAVRIAEPPPPYFPAGGLLAASPGNGPLTAVNGAVAPSATAGMASGTSAVPTSSRSELPFPGTGGFGLNKSSPGTFRLAPTGKSPEPWAIPVAPGPPPRSLGKALHPFRARATTGESFASRAIFLPPFDIRKRAAADWTSAALARIERNWIIPASGRLAFAGRVQITLTIEKSGRRRDLVVDDSSVPEPLTLAALHAVETSLPLPALPADIAGEVFAFVFVFVYNG